MSAEASSTRGLDHRPRRRDDDDDNSSVSSSASSSSGGEEGWDDVEGDGGEDEEEAQQVISLLDDRVFGDIAAMLAHCREQHAFDFLAARQRLQLDFHGCVRLVNFVRQRVHAGQPVPKDADITAADLADDQLLKPVLDDDAVIIGLFDLPELADDEVSASAATGDGAGSQQQQPGEAAGSSSADLRARNAELADQLARVKAEYESYRAAVQRTLEERWGEADDAAPGSKDAAAAAAGKAKVVDDSQYYWDSYAGNDIHETMIKDKVRTDAYRDFIYNNKHLFKGKTVLDIGCGTGILSMFCARAGAARVIAVDASDIIHKARANVYNNGLSGVVTCVHGRVEEVALPGGVEEVDVIVSEWMGYCLLFEAMLPSVLWARDRYLKPQTGLLVPSHASMWCAPVSDREWVADNILWWREVYGFDMSEAMQGGITDEARVLCWPREGLCGDPQRAFKVLDLYAVTAADLEFEAAPFSCPLGASDGDSSVPDTAAGDVLDGFLVWFDMFFSPAREGHPDAVGPADKAAGWAALDPQNRVAFTTGPWGEDTHWKQGLFLNKEILKLGAAGKKEGDDAVEGEEEKKKDKGKDAAGPTTTTTTPLKKGGEISGLIDFTAPADNPRALNIRIAVDGGFTQSWPLA